METNKAIKLDDGKLQYSSIPILALEEVCKSFTYGAKKYGQFNYSKGIEFTRLLDASIRHTIAVLKSEDIDNESGNYHLSHAIASLMMALESQLTNQILDNRNKIYASNCTTNTNNKHDKSTKNKNQINKKIT